MNHAVLREGRVRAGAVLFQAARDEHVLDGAEDIAGGISRHGRQCDMRHAAEGGLFRAGGHPVFPDAVQIEREIEQTGKDFARRCAQHDGAAGVFQSGGGKIQKDSRDDSHSGELFQKFSRRGLDRTAQRDEISAHTGGYRHERQAGDEDPQRRGGGLTAEQIRGDKISARPQRAAGNKAERAAPQDAFQDGVPSAGGPAGSGGFRDESGHGQTDPRGTHRHRQQEHRGDELIQAHPGRADFIGNVNAVSDICGAQDQRGCRHHQRVQEKFSFLHSTGTFSLRPSRYGSHTTGARDFPAFQIYAPPPPNYVQVKHGRICDKQNASG